MNVERYERICHLFGETLEMPIEDRRPFLAQQCPDDASLVDQVIRMHDDDVRAANDGLFDFLAKDSTESFVETQDYVSSDQHRQTQETIVQGEHATEFGDYELLEEMGRGGMGTVYRARQKGTEQVVALKMLRRDWIDRMSGDRRQEVIEQFHLEVRAAARLQHPNIARVFHMGQVGEQPYYAMEFVDGMELAEKLKREGPLNQREAAKRMADVASAVHAAHQRGVLHRDIKPGNILCDEANETTKVADFGLAQLQGDIEGTPNSSGSDTFRVAGTLPYMAPEILIDAENASVYSDVYALGATLFQLLTGQPPFRVEGLSELRTKLESEVAPAPSAVKPGVSPQLDKICLKCLAKNQEARYNSSAELVNDLHAYLNAPKFAAHMALMSNWVLSFSVIVLALNASVFWLLDRSFTEWIVWTLVFTMYPPLLILVANIPRRPEENNRQARAELWSIWLGKLCAAACICVGIRLVLESDARLAIQMSYPVFAALSGMVCFSLGASFWRGFYFSAFGFWGLAFMMMLNLELAPLEYAVYASLATAGFGLYLRKIATDFR